MKVQDVMSRVEVIELGATVRDAAQKMQLLDAGSLPVCSGTRLEGMVTDRDIALRAIAAGEGPDTPVEKVMTPDVVCCCTEQGLDEAAALMASHKLRRLPVLNEDKELVGIVALGDLATTHGAQELGGSVLAKVSEPDKP
jgi:CBS domain-containing protein